MYKPIRAAFRALLWAMEQGADVDDLIAEFHQFEKRLK